MMKSIDTAQPSELHVARGSFRRTLQALALVVFMVAPVAAFASFWLADHLVTSVSAQWAVGTGLVAVLNLPIIVVVLGVIAKRVATADAWADAQQTRLDEERSHRDLESQVTDALEMAETETEALRVIERGFSVVLPDSMTELLLADNSHARLSRKAVSAPAGSVAGCGVGSPQECPAARRARVHRFADSDAVNACPKLAGRVTGRCAAICIPVSVMGRTVGVIHTVHEVDTQVDGGVVQDLEAIAQQAGARLGMLRIVAETQLQAATDALTGLMNRRSFENAFLQMRERSPGGSGVVVMADLDHFKAINDTFGHETGDRALRLFAETLRKTVGPNDLVSRRGGEEFAVFFPSCDQDRATETLGRVRENLQRAIKEAGLPAFTSSFGSTPALLVEDLDLLLARADSALFEAKRSGRDRLVVVVAEAATDDSAAPANRVLDGPNGAADGVVVVLRQAVETATR